VNEEYIGEIEEDEYGSANSGQELYEHFRFVVDKGQAIQLTRYLSNNIKNKNSLLSKLKF
jgi:hypothetical protein